MNGSFESSPDLHRWSHTWIGTDRLLARRFARPVARFLSIEAASGVLLLFATVVALVWANSPWSASYFHFLEADVLLGAGPIDLHLTVQEFVNDALMAFFFFVVGIEIKREMVHGELRDPKTAALPIVGALGGMVVPAAIYFALNAGSSTSHGWGIPMATDIAFAVGIVSLSGRRVPVALKLFLLTLAVTDDLGAIAVIAVFYSKSVALLWLLLSFAVLALVWFLRRRRVWYGPLYFVLGVVAWYFMFRSGVHATVAGVAMGFLIPTEALRPELRAGEIVDRLENRDELTANDVENAAFLLRESVPVGERIIDRWLPWTSYVVIPLFALCNAGVALSGEALRSAAGSTVTWGVGLGLVVGKTLGVFGAATIAIAIGVARRPRGVTSLHLLGISMAAGIGFTVALFVTGLAFDDPTATDQAKVGILAASLVAAVLSALMLRVAASRASSSELASEAEENDELFVESPQGVVIGRDD